MHRPTAVCFSNGSEDAILVPSNIQGFTPCESLIQPTASIGHGTRIINDFVMLRTTVGLTPPIPNSFRVEFRIPQFRIPLASAISQPPPLILDISSGNLLTTLAISASVLLHTRSPRARVCALIIVLSARAQKGIASARVRAYCYSTGSRVRRRREYRINLNNIRSNPFTHLSIHRLRD